MGLIDQFNRLVARLRPVQERTTSDEARPMSRPTALIDKFRIESGRRAMVEDCRQMYDEDPRAAGVIEALARDAVKGGFTVRVTSGSEIAKAQALADDLIERLDLFTRLDDWVRLTLRDGDSFLEAAVDSGGLIAQATRKPTLEMHRNSDRADRFADPRRAYWWADQLWGGHNPPEDAIWFADWQVIHARWRHDEGSRYGRPLFASARKAYKRLSEGETDVAVRRKTRAGMKYLHTIEGDEAAVETYKRLNADALNKPFAAIADFFVNKKASITTVQGDARLNEIDDVLHHIETWAVASPVPLALIGYGKGLNRDILEQKLEQYERALEPVTAWVTTELVKPLLEIQWLVQGIWPDGLEYEIQWASKKVAAPQTLRDVADAGIRLRSLGWPDEIIIEILVPLIPGLDGERLLALMAEAAAQEPDEIGRMADDAG